ncbi:MAG: hypothetical protein ACOVP2_05755 [Armatimonadaceae bacterium]
MRFDARDRRPPRQRTSISLAVFVILLLMISLAGYKGISLITTFLEVAPKHIRPSHSRDIVPVSVEPQSGDKP